MTPIVRLARRRRGLFGILAWRTFLVFNALMGLSFFYAIMFTSAKVGEGVHAEMQAGSSTGGTGTAGVLFWTWLIGAVILGLIVALARRKMDSR